MKKIYLNVSLLIVAVAMVNTMWAQRVRPLAAGPFITTLETAPSNNNLPNSSGSSNDRAFGDVIWSQDFGTTVTGGIPTTWTQTGANPVWKKTFEGSSGQYSSKTQTLNSSTKANGVLIFDGDSVCTKNGANVALNGAVISEQINLTGKPNVKLQFQQYFRLCCNTGTTTITVSVSKDGGTTWTDFNARGVIALNNYPTNPNTFEVNISSATMSSNNVKVKFAFSSETGVYFWQIDDVKIIEGPSHDIRLEQPNVDMGYEEGGYYTQIPAAQLAPMGFRAAVLNDGGLTQTKVRLKVDVSKGSSIYNKTSVPTTITAGARDTLKLLVTSAADKLNLSPVAASIGTYTTTFTFMADSVDQNPSNNVFTKTFAVSDTMYARDFGVTTGSTVGTLGPNNYVNGKEDGAVIASLYEFTKATKIKTASAYITAGSSVGSSFEFVLYDTSLTTEVAVSNIYTVTTTADRDKWVTMKFQTGDYSVAAGSSYYIGMRCYGLSATPVLAISTLNDLSKIDVQRANGSTVFYLPKASP
ncbi:MAG: hypothetical protein H0W84_10455, partial [Bacteroidetes bacterium]|nr:hypothetical protein [Bacteroidota bacterium]